jgi:hypothetical protein
MLLLPQNECDFGCRILMNFLMVFVSGEERLFLL